MTEHDQGIGAAQVLLLTAAAAVGSNSLVLSPILGDVAATLGVGPVTVACAITAYNGAVALSALLLARRIDRVGARRALRLGLAALAGGTFASALAPHWLALALAQGLAGLGAGVALPAIYAMATALAHAGAVSRTLGWVLTGWLVALVLGVPAAALLAEVASWRAPFLALGIAATLVIAGSAVLPADRRRRRSKQGEALPAPLAPLRYPTVAPLLLVCLAYMAAFYGVYAFLGDHLRATLDLPARDAGLVVLAYGVGFGAAGLGDGAIDGLGARRVLPLALLAIALVYAGLAALRSLAAAAALACAWGGANHLGLNGLILLLSRAKPEARGAVLGLNSAVTYLGAALGTGLAGAIYARAGFAWLAGCAALLLVAAAGLAWAALPSPRLSRSSDPGSSPARGC
jgi:predicted MFS family arabinose efflux permease